MEMTNAMIFITIVNYWVFSVLISLIQIYRVRDELLKTKHKIKTQVILEFVNNLWSGVVVRTWKESNKYSKAGIIIMLIPLALLIIISCPIFLPFEILAYIVTIPNDIDKRRKRKARMDSGGAVSAGENEEYQGNYSGNAETVIPEIEKHD